jgi:glycosyltransferase involved in cell wall biosynthesis
MVSVVVPNYNHARFLPKRMESILRQTYQDFDLILLDDCSTDNSRAILSQYSSDPRVHVEFNEVNSSSTYKQWNKGVRLAQGQYVWIAESDDYADDRLLQRLVAILDSDPQIVVAYCRSWRVEEGGRIDGFVYFPPDRLNPRWQTDFCVDGREECRNYFARYNPLRNASAAVFRKAIYEAVGGADETFRLSGDWKLWASMALMGKVAYLSEPLNYQRFHGANTQTNTSAAVTVMEAVRIIRWLSSRITPSDAVVNAFCESIPEFWVPSLMSFRLPLEVKRAIWRDVSSVDPHPFRRVWRPALHTIQRKVVRHWRELRGVVTLAGA